METALAYRLVNDATVDALVEEKIGWGSAEQTWKPPFIVLQTISDPMPQDYAGFVAFRQTRVRIYCYGVDREQTVDLRNAAIPAISAGGVFYGTRFGRASIDTVRDLGANTDTGFVHCDAIDALIWHN